MRQLHLLGDMQTEGFQQITWLAPSACVAGSGCAWHLSALMTIDILTCAQCLGGLLEEEQLQRWEDLELALSLQKMPDCVYCPRCSSACLEDAENCAQCPKCFFAFCSLCNESWHPGIEVRRLLEPH